MAPSGTTPPPHVLGNTAWQPSPDFEATTTTAAPSPPAAAAVVQQHPQQHQQQHEGDAGDDGLAFRSAYSPPHSPRQAHAHTAAAAGAHDPAHTPTRSTAGTPTKSGTFTPPSPSPAHTSAHTASLHQNHPPFPNTTHTPPPCAPTHPAQVLSASQHDSPAHAHPLGQQRAQHGAAQREQQQDDGSDVQPQAHSAALLRQLVADADGAGGVAAVTPQDVVQRLGAIGVEGLEGLSEEELAVVLKQQLQELEVLGHQWRSRLQAGTTGLLSFSHPPAADHPTANTNEHPAAAPPPPSCTQQAQHAAPPRAAGVPLPQAPPSAPAPPAAAPPPPPPLTAEEEEDAERQEYERLSSRFLCTAWGDLGQMARSSTRSSGSAAPASAGAARASAPAAQTQGRAAVSANQPQDRFARVETCSDDGGPTIVAGGFDGSDTDDTDELLARKGTAFVMAPEEQQQHSNASSQAQLAPELQQADTQRIPLGRLMARTEAPGEEQRIDDWLFDFHRQTPPPPAAAAAPGGGSGAVSGGGVCAASTGTQPAGASHSGGVVTAGAVGAGFPASLVHPAMAAPAPPTPAQPQQQQQQQQQGAQEPMMGIEHEPPVAAGAVGAGFPASLAHPAMPAPVPPTSAPPQPQPQQQQQPMVSAAPQPPHLVFDAATQQFVVDTVPQQPILGAAPQEDAMDAEPASGAASHHYTMTAASQQPPMHPTLDSLQARLDALLGNFEDAVQHHDLHPHAHHHSLGHEGDEDDLGDVIADGIAVERVELPGRGSSDELSAASGGSDGAGRAPAVPARAAVFKNALPPPQQEFELVYQ